MSDLTLTRFARRAAASHCLACGMRVPDEDELCPGCGYHHTRELVGGWEPPGPPSDDDSETEAVIERIEGLPAAVVASSRDLAHLLRLALPSEARVYGWWSRDGQESLVAWAWDQGWCITHVSRDANWSADPADVASSALYGHVGPFGSLPELILTAAVSDTCYLGLWPDETCGAAIWGLARLLNRDDQAAVKQALHLRGALVTGRRHDPLGDDTRLL